VERAVRPVLVVLAAVGAEYALEVASVEDQDAVEAFGAERSYPAFGVGVRVRSLDRCADLRVARLLRHPAPVRIRGRGDVLDPALRERDEEQHVDALEQGGFDGEEVAGEHASRLGSREGAPCRMVPLRRR
jgi:hypothetical protein